MSRSYKKPFVKILPLIGVPLDREYTFTYITIVIR